MMLKRHGNVRCDWWKLSKTHNVVKHCLTESFPYEYAIGERFFRSSQEKSLFDYVWRDIVVPEALRKCFANFPPIFKNNNVGREDTGWPLRENAKKEGLSNGRLLISSCFLENGTTITPLLLLCLTWSDWQKKQSICVVHSIKVLQQLYLVWIERYNRGRQESNFYCCDCDNQNARQKLLWFSDYGSKSTDSNRVS